MENKINTLLQAALEYLKDGWKVLPLHSVTGNSCSCGKTSCNSPGKHPRTRHGIKEASLDPDTIKQWWQKHPKSNIGLVLGKESGRIVLDIDIKNGKAGVESLSRMEEENQKLPLTRKIQTPTGGFHYIFKYPSWPIKSVINLRDGVDLLCDNRYFVASPSEINGRKYEVIDFSPEAICPEWLAQMSQQKKTKNQSKVSAGGIRQIIFELFPDGTKQGDEWNLLCPFHKEKHASFFVNLKTGLYHCFGCEKKGNLIQLFSLINHVTESEASSRIYGDDPKIEEMNDKHAVVMVGGRCCILNFGLHPIWGYRDISLSQVHDLELRYKNQKVSTGSKPVNKITYWLTHPLRREYDGIIFEPGLEIPNYFNFWQGFSVVAKKGDCSLFLDHVFNNIASGNKEHYEYIIAFLADIVQRPRHKPGVSLVLCGKQGVGKGIFCTEFGKLFGQHFVHIQHSRHLIGNFNAHLKDSLVVFCDEAFWAGDKASEGALKAMVTEDKIPIEYKGKDVLYVSNYIHLFIASNNAWIVPAGLEERRFFILPVGEEHIQDHNYFSRIQIQMDNGGREALLDMLLNFDLTNYNLRKIPKTSALMENKIYSMSAVEKFWLERLQTGKLSRFQEGWPNLIESKVLHDEFIEFSKCIGFTRKASETELGLGLKKLVPGIRISQKRNNGKRRQYFIIPDLKICREAFEEATNFQFTDEEEDYSGEKMELSEYE